MNLNDIIREMRDELNAICAEAAEAMESEREGA